MSHKSSRARRESACDVMVPAAKTMKQTMATQQEITSMIDNALVRIGDVMAMHGQGSQCIAILDNELRKIGIPMICRVMQRAIGEYDPRTFNPIGTSSYDIAIHQQSDVFVDKKLPPPAGWYATHADRERDLLQNLTANGGSTMAHYVQACLACTDEVREALLEESIRHAKKMGEFHGMRNPCVPLMYAYGVMKRGTSAQRSQGESDGKAALRIASYRGHVFAGTALATAPTPITGALGVTNRSEMVAMLMVGYNAGDHDAGYNLAEHIINEHIHRMEGTYRPRESMFDLTYENAIDIMTNVASCGDPLSQLHLAELCFAGMVPAAGKMRGWLWASMAVEKLSSRFHGHEGARVSKIEATVSCMNIVLTTVHNAHTMGTKVRSIYRRRRWINILMQMVDIPVMPDSRTLELFARDKLDEPQEEEPEEDEEEDAEHPWVSDKSKLLFAGLHRSIKIAMGGEGAGERLHLETDTIFVI